MDTNLIWMRHSYLMGNTFQLILKSGDFSKVVSLAWFELVEPSVHLVCGIVAVQIFRLCSVDDSCNGEHIGCRDDKKLQMAT